MRALLVWTGRLLLALFFAAGLTILIGRYFLLPEIAAQREAVEQRLSAVLGLPVKMRAMTASWPGLHPHLSIDGMQVFDGDGRPALTFDRVEAEIGWSSLLHFELRLHRFEVFAPQVDIRRDAEGQIFIAGLPVQTEGEGDFLRWLLEQRRIIVRDARVVWHDEQRGAPPLELQQVNFDLRKLGWQHSFGLTAQPPAALAGALDLRGSLVGSDPADLPQWRGELYAELAQADVAAWKPWLDLPLEWSRGRGGVRAWLDFAQMKPTALTLDLQLADVSMRLGKDLPELALAHLEGRISGKRDKDAYAGELQRLSLATPEGIVLPPTDVHLKLVPEGGKAGGEFAANSLDLAALAALAGRLPLPAHLHERLAAFAPRGKLADLELQWEGPAEAPAHWRANGRFAELALAAHKELPGFAGISGRLKGDERSGEVQIDSRNVRIELPAVFPEPTLGLESLQAELGWRARQGGGVELLLSRAAFNNDDASGEATGSYRYTGQGPGEIDLSAKLTKAAGNAVWRYMPLVVNKDARDWLRASIKGGRADSATLRLKGPLAQFPFRGGKGGIFQVKGNFRNATLSYADGWPEIAGIDGELLFEGERMQIRGKRAEVMGVALADVLAEIADLEAPEELLVVTGRARGETQRFLDFIEASPVGAWIDHFTQPMKAEGSGELALRLDLPLRHIADSRVKGSYRFAANRIRVLPELPPVSDAEGEVGFTENRLQAKGLRGRLFGNPLNVDVSSAQGGAVLVSGNGTVAAQALRQEYGWRALDHLSGEFPWRGSVTVKKPAAEISIESSLEGLSSSLPEPFNKSVRAALPLKLTGSIEHGRSEWAATLGEAAALRLAQAGESWRGRAALGAGAQKAAAALPGRGVALSIDLPRIDADAWRSVLAGPESGGGPGAAPLQLAAIDLRSASVHVLNRDFHDVRISGTPADARWRFAIDSREAKGQLSWDGAGAGRIAGRFAQLIVPKAAHAEPEQDAAPADTTQELPAVDLVIDNFRVRDMALGEVRVNAENQGGVWEAKLEVKNDAARLTGEGRWRPSRVAPETALGFKLAVGDAEKLLARMGMPDAVRRGDGQIEGELSWAGTPFSFDIPSLSGRIKADIGKGQFKKLEPGVGRLLGVLSLQSLPRRITLDFRDIFSEGFAFDSIVGEAKVSRGMMQTDELKIRGPAAKILLSGQANLVAETQNLKVRVQPALGETIAVGAMLANPATGAVAWLAQKILDDPLDQVFAYEYAVTGAWSDPKVEKINRSSAEAKPATPP